MLYRTNDTFKLCGPFICYFKNVPFESNLIGFIMNIMANKHSIWLSVAFLVIKGSIWLEAVWYHNQFCEMKLSDNALNVFGNKKFDMIPTFILQSTELCCILTIQLHCCTTMLLAFWSNMVGFLGLHVLVKSFSLSQFCHRLKTIPYSNHNFFH